MTYRMPDLFGILVARSTFCAHKCFNFYDPQLNLPFNINFCYIRSYICIYCHIEICDITDIIYLRTKVRAKQQ